MVRKYLSDSLRLVRQVFDHFRKGHDRRVAKEFVFASLAAFL